MDLRELFDVEVAVKYEVPDPDGHIVTIMFYFRQPKPDEEMEFRKRSARQRIRDNGTIEPSDISLKAPLYLYERLCKKVTKQNGTAEAVVVSTEEASAIPVQMKVDAVLNARNRIKKVDDEQLRD